MFAANNSSALAFANTWVSVLASDGSKPHSHSMQSLLRRCGVGHAVSVSRQAGSWCQHTLPDSLCLLSSSLLLLPEVFISCRKGGMPLDDVPDLIKCILLFNYQLQITLMPAKGRNLPMSSFLRKDVAARIVDWQMHTSCFSPQCSARHLARIEGFQQVHPAAEGKIWQ